MAAVAGTQVKTVLSVGQGQVVEWLEINNVDTGDTVDVGSIGAVVFKKVEAAVFFGRAQGTGIAGTIVGTVITMTSAGLTDDTVDILVLGES